MLTIRTNCQYIVRMPHKLTLKLDENIVEKAKNYAKEHNSSVSKLVEEYFRFITMDSSEIDKVRITPTIKKLSGILNSKSIDPKLERAEYLSKKHSL